MANYWVNNTTPPINADNLNRIEDGIFNAEKSWQIIHQSGLDEKATAFGDILNTLISNISKDNSQTSDITVNDKISLAKLKALLSQMTYDGTDITFNGYNICTEENYGNYVFTAYADNDVSGISTDYVHIRLDKTNTADVWKSITITLNNTNNFTIGGNGSSIPFFNNDTLKCVEIDIKRMVTENTPRALVTVSGFNDFGANYKQVSKILQIAKITQITITAKKSDDAAMSMSKEILYSEPGSEIGQQQMFDIYETETFGDN